MVYEETVPHPHIKDGQVTALIGLLACQKHIGIPTFNQERHQQATNTSPRNSKYKHNINIKPNDHE